MIQALKYAWVLALVVGASLAEENAELERTAANLAETNRKQGEAFLAHNKTQPGVVALESGLQYTILEPGDGARPRIDDVVIAHYRGTLVDGTEFDSSRARGQPATFRVNRLIKGWTQALQLMPVGSKWRIVLPPELAYGSRAAGDKIGPNSTLIFDIELLGIGAATGATVRPSSPSKIADLRFSYRLDPRLTRGLYMGERWISVPTFSGIAGQTAVKTRVEGLDTQGRPIVVQPRWTVSDESMVTVTPSEGSEVEINVKRAGLSTLQVTFDAVTTELVIHAEQEGESLKLEIAKKS
jgi:FKBP-type peptidyl-prolyl cis-trans isomerase FklB